MSTSKRRARRKRAKGSAEPAQELQVEPEAAKAPPIALAEWKWATFPVYFAFSGGLFIGVYSGAIGIWAERQGNNNVFLVVSVTASLLLGFALSRLVLRFVIGRRWIRPKAKKRS